MDASKNDSDSSDSEVFVLKQVKPVNKLTIQQALLIKHEVLNSFLKKDSNKNKRKAERCKQDFTLEEGSNSVNKISKIVGSSEGKEIINWKNIQKRNNKIKVVQKEVGKRLQSETTSGETFSPKSPEVSTNVFDLFKVSPQKIKTEECNTENVHLSPGICRKINKFKTPNSSSPKSPRCRTSQKKVFVKTCCNLQGKKNLLKIFNGEVSQVYDGSLKTNFELRDSLENDELQFNDYITVLNSYKDVDEKKCISNSELLSFILKKIIHDEIRKQMELQISSSKQGERVEKLLSENECEVLEKFFNLNENACKVYVRMLCRKKDWHRVSAINYKDISNDLQSEFNLLHEENFVDINIEKESLKTQMDLLSKLEVQQLCKLFNVPQKTFSACKKQDLISSLIEESKTQKSVMDMLKKNDSSSRVSLLKSEVTKYLGMCVKINEKSLSVFNKILLLFSFPHYFDEEDKRLSTQLFLCLKVFKNDMRFPPYNLSPTVIFQTCEDFESYQKAVLLQDDFEIAISQKRLEKFQDIANTAKLEFKKLLLDKEFEKRFLNLEPFLRKFSAGSIYGRILTRYCKILKKKTDPEEVVSICQMLLEQNLFMISKRGEWYEILSKALERLKNNNAAAEVLIQSQRDSYIDEVQKFSLQLRGRMILKRKMNGISETGLREVLDDLCTISVQEPPSIEIKGKPVQGNKTGYKSIYIEECEGGKRYTSVEERAISYYKSIGFTNGYHVEGSIIQSIYFLLFFDTIYGVSPPGVFQSYFQEAPLDLNSRYFYINRKDEIDLLIQQISEWDICQVESKLKDIYYRNYEMSCVIPWSQQFTPELFCEIIQCISLPVLARIFQRFVKNFRVTRSGFPDLTLWNPETGKCKFVEVKSSNDKLSPNQRLWLDYLRSIGVDCEVCNVKSTTVKVCS